MQSFNFVNFPLSNKPQIGFKILTVNRMKWHESCADYNLIICL